MPLRRQGYDLFEPNKIWEETDRRQAALLAIQYQALPQIPATRMRTCFVPALDDVRLILTFQSQAKKMLNVDSPSFTPSFLSPNGSNAITVKKPAGISPKAASAAPFMPKAIITRENISSAFSTSSAHSGSQVLQIPLHSVKTLEHLTGFCLTYKSLYLGNNRSHLW